MEEMEINLQSGIQCFAFDDFGAGDCERDGGVL